MFCFPFLHRFSWNRPFDIINGGDMVSLGIHTRIKKTFTRIRYSMITMVRIKCLYAMEGSIMHTRCIFLLETGAITSICLEVRAHLSFHSAITPTIRTRSQLDRDYHSSIYCLIIGCPKTPIVTKAIPVVSYERACLNDIPSSRILF